MPNGTHTLKVTAHDGSPAANEATVSVNVTVNNTVIPPDTTPPNVILLNPGTQTVNGNVTVHSVAWDDSGIYDIVLKIDGVVVETVTLIDVTDHYFVWDSTKVANGLHTVQVCARDKAQPPNTGCSMVPNVTVAN